MSHRIHDDNEAAFHRDGFVAVDKFASDKEISRIKTILLDLHENNAGFREGAQFDAAAPVEGDPKSRRFPQILHPHVFAKELASTEYFKAGLEIARQLLGPSARFQTDISFLKPPKIGSDTPWHQDQAFSNPAYENEQITIWLAVTPASATNSCMSFIPKSHSLPVLKHRPIGGDPRVHALECVDDFDRSGAIECPLPAGGMTIHGHRTLHYAGPNRSDEARLAYALLFDTPYKPRAGALDFSWNKEQLTDRQLREQNWRRRGGILSHMWRQRHRLQPVQLMTKLRWPKA